MSALLETPGPAPRQGGSTAEPAAAVEHVLTVDCAESPGIVHAVSAFLLGHGCDIIDIKQYGDKAQGHFFMRVHFSSEQSAPDAELLSTEDLRRDFGPMGEKWQM